MTHGTNPSPEQQWSKLRRSTRFQTDVRVIITPKEDGHESQPIHGRVGVIAGGGFGATLAGELAVGQTVAAELLLVGEGRAPLHATAVVRERHGFRHGFEFLDVTPDQRAAIREFCALLEPAE